MIQIHPLLLITPLIILVCIFFYNYLLKIRLSAFFLTRMNAEKTELTFADKVLGGIIYGFIPFLLLVSFPGKNPESLGITTGKMSDLRITVVLSAILLLIISYRLSANKKLRDQMLKTEKENLTIKSGLLIASGWIIYIFGYELMFRGILWFTFYNELGFVPALLVNLGLYALAHYNMNKTTILGSIPVGILFCSLSYFTGSFLFSFILHSIMSSGFEIFSLHRVTAGKLSTER